MDAFNGDEMRSNVNIDYSPEESQAGIKKKIILYFPVTSHCCPKFPFSLKNNLKQTYWKTPSKISEKDRLEHLFELKHKAWNHLSQQNSLLSNEKQHFFQIRL